MSRIILFAAIALVALLPAGSALAGPGCQGKGKGGFQQQQAFKQFQQMQQLAKQNKAMQGQLKQGKK